MLLIVKPSQVGNLFYINVGVFFGDVLLCIYYTTVDAAYKTHGYKIQSLIGLKIVWNGPDLSKYIKKKIGYKTQIS